MKRKEEICNSFREESNHLGIGFVAVHVGKVLISNHLNICIILLFISLFSLQGGQTTEYRATFEAIQIKLARQLVDRS